MLSLCQVEADGTQPDFLLHFQNAVSQPSGVVYGKAKDVGSKPRCRFFTDAGEPPEFFNQAFDGKCITCHR
jgi:hypothetical protein